MQILWEFGHIVKEFISTMKVNLIKAVLKILMIMTAKLSENENLIIQFLKHIGDFLSAGKQRKEF